MPAEPHRIEGILKCFDCDAEHPTDAKSLFCGACGGLLEVIVPENLILSITWNLFASRPKGVWRYRELLLVDQSKAVTLGEGGTPLVDSPRLAQWVGVGRLWLKCEGVNPTGSFKDRGMTVGVTRAVQTGARIVCCASTGNTSASLAAYAARAGLRSVVFLPKGAVATGKLAQAILHGADIVEVDGNFDEALKLLVEISARAGLYLLNSVNPWRLEGQKTAALEVAEELREGFDLLSIPVGNCGNLSAYWKGFAELHRAGLINWLPKLLGVQAEGASPIVQLLAKGLEDLVPVKSPETVATALRIGNPVNWKKAKRAILDSNGMAISVSDKEILEAQRAIARLAGLGVEPAAAASVAGLKRLVELGELSGGKSAVAVLTGHALKDSDAAMNAPTRRLTLDAFLSELS